jgi:hypothetical protein
MCGMGMFLLFLSIMFLCGLFIGILLLIVFLSLLTIMHNAKHE